MLSVALSLTPAFAGTAGRYPAPLFRGARTFLAPRFRGGRGRPALWQGEYRGKRAQLRVSRWCPFWVESGH